MKSKNDQVLQGSHKEAVKGLMESVDNGNIEQTDNGKFKLTNNGVDKAQELIATSEEALEMIIGLHTKFLYEKDPSQPFGNVLLMITSLMPDKFAKILSKQPLFINASSLSDLTIEEVYQDMTREE